MKSATRSREYKVRHERIRKEVGSVLDATTTNRLEEIMVIIIRGERVKAKKNYVIH